MKKTIAIIGSVAAMSFAGAGIATAQSELPEAGSTDAAAETYQDGDDGETDNPEAPGEVSSFAQQLCGSINAYDFLGSAEGVVPGLSGEECEANASLAVETAMTGDIGGAIDILRGIEDGASEEDDENAEETGSAAAVGSLGDAAADDDTNDDEVEADAVA